MTKYYRVMADPDLPRGARLEAGQRNKFKDQTFPTMGAALVARGLLEDPDRYVAVECQATGFVPLGAARKR